LYEELSPHGVVMQPLSAATTETAIRTCKAARCDFFVI
jgi:hypothetical protein